MRHVPVTLVADAAPADSLAVELTEGVLAAGETGPERADDFRLSGAGAGLSIRWM
jgi:hypothetical protein